jgi:hypothetical protein
VDHPHEGAEAPTLLDALARAPAARALIVAPLAPKARRAAREAHPALHAAVDETTVKLCVAGSFGNADSDGDRECKVLAAAAPRMAAVSSLEFKYWRVTAVGVRSLASTGWRLRRLTLSQLYTQGDECAADKVAAALAECASLAGMRVLQFELCQLSAAGRAGRRALVRQPAGAGLDGRGRRYWRR